VEMSQPVFILKLWSWMFYVDHKSLKHSNKNAQTSANYVRMCFKRNKHL
jgi:hypothetical protein